MQCSLLIIYCKSLSSGKYKWRYLDYSQLKCYIGIICVLADSLFIYSFLEKHIDLIPALLRHAGDDNLA